MLHICAVRFDVTENLEKFGFLVELNKAGSRLQKRLEPKYYS